MQGIEGSRFIVIVRQAEANPLDFSVILACYPGKSNERFRLRRYNGKSHTHSNKLEREGPFYDFHIHQATERYQDAGFKEDAYATPTDRYADFHQALNCLVADCGFEESQGGGLFPQ